MSDTAFGSQEVSRPRFEQAATTVLGGLQRALQDLAAAAPSEIRKVVDVEQIFGVNRLLGWQIFRILNADDPLAVSSYVPARVSIKKFLIAAKPLIPAETITQVWLAFDAFEKFVSENATEREEFDAILSSFLPEERPKQELASKQAAFKAMSQIKGVAIETSVAVNFYLPSAGRETMDQVVITGDFGVRRTRPNARIELGVGDLVPTPDMGLTLDGRPCNNMLDKLLPQFSTSPLPVFDIRQQGNTLYYFVKDQEVGMRSAIDLVHVDRQVGLKRRYTKPGEPRQGDGLMSTITTPTRRLIMDIFLHRDIYPDAQPIMGIHETAVRNSATEGIGNVLEYDRLEMHEAVRELTPGIAGARVPNLPQYADILEHAHDALGVGASDFRGFRLDVQYPVYSLQYRLGFPLPVQ